VNAAIIVAGGSGERSGLAAGKQLAVVAGRPVLSYALAAFDACPAIHEIVVVAHPDRMDEYRAVAVDPVASAKVSRIVGGGSTRQRSVAAGLEAVSSSAQTIIVHDGARPLVTEGLVTAVMEALERDGSLDGLVVGHPSFDTLKSVDVDRVVLGTLDRNAVWAAQTPQAFRARVLREAYAQAMAEGFEGTDDASLVERLGRRVGMFQGPRDNLKITVPEDLLVVERLLARGAEGRRGE